MPADRTVQFKNGTLPAAGATDAVIQAAIPGRKIRLLALRVFPTTTPPASVTVASKGSGAGTAISPVYPLAASTPLQIDGSGDGVGLCDTNQGEALTVTNPAGTTLAVYQAAYVVMS
jgi:hypothetical protein